MDEQRQKREQRILDVAKCHFEKYGYKRTVIDDIAREVGIAKGTFYLHFKSKQELYLRIVQRIQEQSIAVFAEQLEKMQTPAELMRNLLYIAVDLLRKEPLILETLNAGADHFVMKNLMAQPKMNRDMDASLVFYKHVLEEGIRIGEFRKDLDLKVTPFALGSIKFLFPYRDLVTSGWVTEKEFWDGYIDILMRGMMKTGWSEVNPRHRRKWDNPYAA
ncbi:MAG: TetR/AcrR family transcriptional regulator [bacterium]